jgi:seryl-tRNA synthetase
MKNDEQQQAGTEPANVPAVDGDTSTQARIERLTRENEEFRRRADEERRSRLTEDQQVREERDSLAQEVQRLQTREMQSRIGAEFRLPAEIAQRLNGATEEEMRTDAEALSRHVARPHAGTPTDPAREPRAPQTIKRSQLRANPEFARSPEVMRAAREGRIVND